MLSSSIIYQITVLTLFKQTLKYHQGFDPVFRCDFTLLPFLPFSSNLFTYDLTQYTHYVGCLMFYYVYFKIPNIWLRIDLHLYLFYFTSLQARITVLFKTVISIQKNEFTKFTYITVITLLQKSRFQVRPVTSLIYCKMVSN